MTARCCRLTRGTRPSATPNGLWGMLNDGRVGGFFQPRANTGASLKATWNGIGYNSCAEELEVSPAEIWIGLKNSDDVGTRFDLKAEVFENGSLIGSGETRRRPRRLERLQQRRPPDDQPRPRPPRERPCAPATRSPSRSPSVSPPTGHRSGTARLWYNDAAANSRFGVTVLGTTSNLYLLDGFVLGTSPGAGPRKTIDVFVDRAENGNPFKPFGTWSKTF